MSADDDAEPEVWLVRHGETEWSKSGQHTGQTDLPLTEAGVEAARSLAPRLAEIEFDQVLCSPLLRARHTAELAKVEGVHRCDDLVEWDYGDYEGRTRKEIHARRPRWSIWTDGAPNGESPEVVSARVDRVITGCRDHGGRSLLIGHGHLLRALAARWIDQPVLAGQHLPLDTGKVSLLGYDRGTPTIERWNSES